MSSGITRARKWISRVLLVLFTRATRFCARLLPYSLAIAAGGSLGFVVYYLLPRDRERARTHLALVFPERDRAWVDRTARSTFVHLGKALFEVSGVTRGRLKGRVVMQGRENLQRAMDEGKGVVYVTGHIGNWEIMADAIAELFPVSVVAAPIEPEPVNDLIVDLRARMGVRTILRNRPGASRELIRVFRENRILGILIDQDTDVESVFVDFMGRPARTPSAAAQMALKFGAPVIFGYTQRGKDDRHTVVLEGPLPLIRTGNMDDDVTSNTALFTRKIESVILRNPEQWVWMHRRWRRQP